MIEIEKNITHEISSLAEYISVIKEKHLERCISRGENQLYKSLNAAAFRRNSYLNIQNMINEFQNYVGNSLTEMQNKHILAFSQHHGLPTNLLDFTYSPLVSLYFACIGKNEKQGFVHFIKSERLINITHHLELVNSLLLLQFMAVSDEVMCLFDSISNLLARHEEYVLEFLELINKMIGSYQENESIHKEINNILMAIANGRRYEIDMLDKLITLMNKRIFDKELRKEINAKYIGSYNRIFIQLLHILILSGHQKINKIDLPFYFIYEPANILNRISNQSSVFIYQLYGISDARQSINPDYTAVISNKSEILKDLDYMGINDKFIFNDYDHIASYIRNKHLEISDEQEKIILNLKNMANSLLKNE